MHRVSKSCALLAVAFAALGWAHFAAAVEAQAPPVRAGFGPLAIGLGFVPRALPRGIPTPVAFSVSAGIEAPEGAQPPALRELTLGIDRNVEFHTEGVPVCHPSVEVPMTKSCRESIIGRGSMNVEIVFPEQPPIATRSKLLILNGASRKV